MKMNKIKMKKMNKMINKEDDKEEEEEIKCISVLMRLVSRRGGSLNWT